MCQNRYGWYSYKAFKNNKVSHIWLSPDGVEVNLTSVSNDQNNPSSMFGDEVFVGPVTKWLRNIEGSTDHFDIYIKNINRGS